MGKKIESVRNKAKEGSDLFKTSAELGKNAVRDVKQMRGLIDSLPTDVDDEIANAARAVEQGTKSDAEGYMKLEVNSRLEAGKNSMEKSSTEAGEQVRNNEKVQSIFSQMDGIGAFGKNARAEGNKSIEQSTNEFNKEIAQNVENTRNAEQEFKQSLSDISSTF